jgi:hypothetical protein
MPIWPITARRRGEPRSLGASLGDGRRRVSEPRPADVPDDLAALRRDANAWALAAAEIWALCAAVTGVVCAEYI